MADLINKSSCIIVQIGHDVGGNFNIHMWAAQGISLLEIGKKVVLC